MINSSFLTAKKHFQRCWSQDVTVDRISAAKTMLGLIVNSALLAASFTDRYESLKRFSRACSSIGAFGAVSPIFHALFLSKRELPLLKSAPETWRGREFRSAGVNEKDLTEVIVYNTVKSRKLKVIALVSVTVTESCLLASIFLKYFPLVNRLQISSNLVDVFQKNLCLSGYATMAARLGDMVNQAKETGVAPEKKKLVVQGYYITKSLIRLGFFASQVAWLTPVNELVHHAVNIPDLFRLMPNAGK